MILMASVWQQKGMYLVKLCQEERENGIMADQVAALREKDLKTTQKRSKAIWVI